MRTDRKIIDDAQYEIVESTVDEVRMLVEELAIRLQRIRYAREATSSS